jgi:hypothetical protein
MYYSYVESIEGCDGWMKRWNEITNPSQNKWPLSQLPKNEMWRIMLTKSNTVLENVFCIAIHFLRWSKAILSPVALILTNEGNSLFFSWPLEQNVDCIGLYSRHQKSLNFINPRLMLMFPSDTAEEASFQMGLSDLTYSICYVLMTEKCDQKFVRISSFWYKFLHTLYRTKIF